MKKKFLVFICLIAWVGILSGCRTIHVGGTGGVGGVYGSGGVTIAVPKI